MKKSAFICLAALLVFKGVATCVEFQDPKAVLAADFPQGWKEGKSKDPSVILRVEKGRAFFEFAGLESELGEYYLKARLKEQVNSLRSNGTNLSGDINPVSLHGVSYAYYISYESMGEQCHVAFFTYKGASYAISASAVSEGEFRAAVSTIRKPGEKIEPPKPKKIRAAKIKNDEEEASGSQVFRGEEPAVSISSLAAAEAVSGTAEPGPEPAPAEPTMAEKTGSFIAELAAKGAAGGLSPYVNRKPLRLQIWSALILLWLAGSFIARGQARACQNPKLPPPPKEVPPDFFFPFLVSRWDTLRSVTYNIVTRQKQTLLAEYESDYEFYLAAAVYGALLLNFVWSLLDFAGRGALLGGCLLPFPGGRFLASFPEAVFLLPLSAGAIKYLKRDPALRLFDAQSNLLLEVRKEVAYGLLRDGKGKEIARLVAKTGPAGRRWEYVDIDNMVVFSIRDDSPRLHSMRKLFGCLGGVLRARYGIFAQERRAGYVFLDPSSADQFQIHLDFDFARLAHPAHILASALYIISREKDPEYPSPF